MTLLQQTKDPSSSINHTTTSSNTTSGAGFYYSHWILDSGATYHICPSKFSFVSLHSIAPIPIKLPNKTTVFAKFAGTIHLGSLTLKNALYVPNFSVHLISIPKLISTLNCMILFCDIHCFIMQTSPLQMIGTVRQQHGLFYLQQFSDSVLNRNISHKPCFPAHFSSVMTIDNS